MCTARACSAFIEYLDSKKVSQPSHWAIFSEHPVLCLTLFRMFFRYRDQEEEEKNRVSEQKQEEVSPLDHQAFNENKTITSTDTSKQVFEDLEKKQEFTDINSVQNGPVTFRLKSKDIKPNGGDSDGDSSRKSLPTSLGKYKCGL